jgi:hypothetical protein
MLHIRPAVTLNMPMIMRSEGTGCHGMMGERREETNQHDDGKVRSDEGTVIVARLVVRVRSTIVCV